MAVIESKRTLSDMEFFKNANELRKEITMLLLRDFGIKNRTRNLKILTNNKYEEDDIQIIESIIDKYGLDKDICDEYPKWMIENMRSNILSLCHELIKNITMANSIYGKNSLQEFYQRRYYQNLSISTCEALFQEFQYVISVIPVDINKYKKYTEMLNKEVALLKKWKKSENKILNKLLEEEKQGKEK